MFIAITLTLFTFPSPPLHLRGQLLTGGSRQAPALSRASGRTGPQIGVCATVIVRLHFTSSLTRASVTDCTPAQFTISQNLSTLAS